MRKFSRALLCLAILAGVLVAAGGRASAVCMDDGFGNTSFATAYGLASADGLDGVVCSGVPDYYVMYIPAHRTGDVSVDPEASSDLGVIVYDADGNVVGGVDDGFAGDPEHVLFTPTVSGFYFFSPTDDGPGLNGGAYHLQVGSLGAVALDQTVPVTFTEDFNSLNAAPSPQPYPAGIAFEESGDGGNGRYSRDDGATPQGDSYAYGVEGDGDLAAGSLRDAHASSSIVAMFVNRTGATINSLSATYAGEQYRLDAVGRNTSALYPQRDRLDATISTIDTDFFTSRLSLVAPVNRGPTGAREVPDTTIVKGSVNGLGVPNNGVFVIRWSDASIRGGEDGLAIDDLVIAVDDTPIDLDIDGIVDSGDDCPTTTTGPVAGNGCSPSDTQVDAVVVDPAVGEGVYDATGATEVVNAKAKKGTKTTFDLAFENDGNTRQQLKVAGCSAPNGFNVKYVADGVDITSLVTSSFFQTDLVDAGQTQAVQMVITATKSAKGTMSCHITGSSTLSSAADDGVTINLKVK